MATVWINELHYDNDSTDTNEFIEIAGLAGTDLTGWSLALYNGNPAQRSVYDTVSLTSLGVVGNMSNGFGVVSIDRAGIQNGNGGGTEPDGIALVDAGGNVVEFISYEGVFTAASGPAAGLTSTNIGVFESGTGPLTGSIQRSGTGDDSTDFTTWTVTDPNTEGAVNAGQTFTGGPPTPTISVAPLSADKAEGNAGLTSYTFTVSRTGDLVGDATVNYAVTGSGGNPANAADFGGTLPSGTATIPDGEASVVVTIEVAGDTTTETDDGFTITLSDPSMGYSLGTAATAGVIRNDDVTITAIYTIQGASHTSTFANTTATTTGIVTAVGFNGYFLQDPTGDGNIATSDAIFVFTGTGGFKPAVGDAVQVTGTVQEFRPGTGQLTLTQIGGTVSTLVQSSGNPIPVATLIGEAGRLPPLGPIDDDAFGSFDPTTDGLDFFESLEGMRVTIGESRTISATNAFEEVWVTLAGQDDPASTNDRGGLTISDGDFNSQRIQLDDELDRAGITIQPLDVGATLAPITGVMNYNFSNYEVLITAAPFVTEESTIEEEVTTIESGPKTLTFASYNVLNLDPKVEDPAKLAPNNSPDDDVGNGQFAGIARQIVDHLNSPAIIALQEMQDDTGAEINDGVTSAALTAQTLIDAIVAEGGPTYVYVDVAPTEGSSGGQPGGNIRPGFLYNPEVVNLVPGSVHTLVDTDLSNGDAFAASRRPLVAEFVFNGQTVTFINNHLNSKGGDNPLFGQNQPPVLNSEAQRVQQAQIINDYVDSLLAEDPDALIVVMGDLNDFSWSNPLTTLRGGLVNPVLFDLADELIADPAERYSFNFDGNSQELDHMLVSQAVLELMSPQFDIVHTNSEFANGVTDHDPSVGSMEINAVPVLPEPQTVTLEQASTDKPLEIVLPTDEDGDALTFEVETLPAEGEVRLNGVALTVGQTLTAAQVANLTYTASEISNGSFSLALSFTDGSSPDQTLTIGLEVTPPVDNVYIGTDDPDRLDGAAGNDTLFGAGGADTLIGGIGSDVLVGGADDDVMRGGKGDDVYLVEDAGDSVFENTEEGADSVLATVDHELSDNVESLFLLAGASTGTGNDGDNYIDASLAGGGATTLNGGGGVDVLIGGAGADAMNGDDGNDFFVGSAGADAIDGGADVDAVTYATAGAGVAVRLDLGLGIVSDADGDSYTGVENVVGSAHADVIVGDGGANTVFGLDGADALYGGGGADGLVGGAGADHLFGDVGGDILIGGADADVFRFAYAESGAASASGDWDVVTDFEDGVDFLLFEDGYAAEGGVMYLQVGADLLITTAALGFTGGVIVQNATEAQIVDQVLVV